MVCAPLAGVRPVTRVVDLIRRYPVVAAVSLIGALMIIASSFVLSETALMWAGGAVGLLIGGAIVVSQRRDERTPPR